MHVFAHTRVQKVSLQALVYVFSSPIGRMTGIKVKLSKYFQLFFFGITEGKLINPEKKLENSRFSSYISNSELFT